MTFYNQERVDKKYSVVLTEWKAAREKERAKLSNSVDSTLISLGDRDAMLNLFSYDSAGVSVTPKSSQRLSAVTACVRILSDSMSTLPLHHYKRLDDGSRERVKNSPIERLFNSSPTDNWTSAAMVQYWENCICYRGDSINYIQRDRLGRAVAIIPFHNDDVSWSLFNGDLIYRFYPRDGQAPFTASSADVLHFTGEGFDGVKSRSVITSNAYHGVAVGLSSNQYSRKFFENGAQPKHIFETDKEMSPELIDTFRDVYSTRYSGPVNSGKPMVLTEGLKLREMTMTSVDAQLLETMKYSVIDIARAFGVPPILIGSQETTSSWGTGVTEIKNGFLTFRLEPKANMWEQELNRKLVYAPDEFLEFEFAGYLRGNTKEENEALRQAIGGSNGPGWMTINEVRKTKNLPSIDGGDQLYIPKGANNEQKTPAAN